MIDNLLGKADKLLIGGGMVFTFLAAQGHGVGKSLLEEDQVDTCKEYLQRAGRAGVEIAAADRHRGRRRSSRPTREPTVVAADAIPDDMIGLDIGPDSGEAFAAAIAGAKTVFWNGPMGVFEFDAFAAGTRAVARR